ncbi:endonuclease/exonuclease/phosphatase family protein [Pedobacter sp. AW31-3R]|uniref:endonuclease/exonuclease/phosphatase family protein n=1 Tax=Pedobacter sp. AW31-3R TaxID=3445781 RepID=UPI003F9FDC13
MKKRKLTFLGKLQLFIAVVLAICLVLGILAGKLDPRDYILIAFFGLAYPFFLLLNAVMIVLWLLGKRWIFALLTAGIIVSGWHALIATVGFVGERGEGPKADPSLVRMMTYNVHSFKPYGEENNESVKQQMLALVGNENPDIICFQEYYSRRKGSFDTIDSLKKILKTKNYYFQPTGENNYEAHGLAIFSRYPIVDKGHISFENNTTGNESIYVDVMIGKKKVRVYNVHFQSISFDKQDYTYLDKVKEKIDTELTPAKRILRMLKTAFKKRSAQVDQMKEHLATCEIPYLIAGDFNDTPASYAVTQMTKPLNNTFVAEGTGLGRTYNGKFPNFQIDYISVTKDIQVVNHRIIETKLSDHFPVRSDLRIN